MPLSLNTNVAATGILSNLDHAQALFGRQVERLSSGLRINRAADDPAGLVIAEKYRAQIDGLGQAIANARDGTNLVQTAEGALDEIATQLRTMRTLAVHAAQTATNDSDVLDADRSQAIRARSTIDAIAKFTQFGSTNLLSAGYTGTFQLGAFSAQSATLTISAMTGAALGVHTPDLYLTDAALMIDHCDVAIAIVSKQRAALGSFQKDTLEATVRNSLVSQQNLRTTESTVSDANTAEEALSFTRASILQQTGLAMLAQANQAPQQLLALFR